MKLSLAWIFDHIDADWRTIDVRNLVDSFNSSVAEIEQCNSIAIDATNNVPGKVVDIVETHVVVYCPLWDCKAQLPLRTDAYKDQWYIINRTDGIYHWATTQFFGSTKETIIPSFEYMASLTHEEWKLGLEDGDYSIEIDNKSITHRPDLWSHRGCAREIAALLNVPLKPLQNFQATVPVMQSEKTGYMDNRFSLTIQASEVCKRLAGIAIENLEVKPSQLWIVSRLSRIDSKSINNIVDATNYTMYDLGHPMHAFDADVLKHKHIIVRYGRDKEQLTLLDGQTITLTNNDLILADEDQPIALAGVMGGLYCGITNRTRNVLFESAWFNPVAVRHAAQRYKKRTDASARFEKNIDPSGNVIALKRCLQLLNIEERSNGLQGKEIISLGMPQKTHVIEIHHNFIESCLGISVASSFISTLLPKLGFEVTEKKDISGLVYQITVPTFRATKDIQLPEDIVEEVGRFLGYTNITPQLPHKATTIIDVHAIQQAHTIRATCAYALTMQELYTYAFFDETVLREINWTPENAVAVQNPVSDNWQRLVTSLIPTLCRTVQINVHEHQMLNFFELARVWQASGDTVIEQKSLAGIFYNHAAAVDFYDAKSNLEQLFHALQLPVDWYPLKSWVNQWYDEQRTAVIMYKDKSIGLAGIANKHFLKKFDLHNAFIFELDADFLLHYRPANSVFKAVSKYPLVERDISIFVPLSAMVDDIQKIIQKADAHIKAAYLIDFFEKREWKDKKALTLHLIIQDEEKTLKTIEVDGIMKKVVEALQALGAEIR